MSPRSRLALRAAALAATAAVAYACTDADRSSDLSGPNADAGSAGTHVQYGTPVHLGNGRARAYAQLDARTGRTLELGVALDESAMEGLRAADPTRGDHEDMDMLELPLPARHGTAFRFVELDWNPKGHGFPHAMPHFDFHFYTIAPEERHAIMPSDPQYAARAAHDPPAASVPPFYVNPAALLGVPPEAVAVPMMGMHWIDPRSPELQALPGGDPTKYRPFTTTFLYGAWDGRFIFMEPMITRDYILAKREAVTVAGRSEVVPIPTSPTYPGGSFRPNAYRIAWDAARREFRVALLATGA